MRKKTYILPFVVTVEAEGDLDLLASDLFSSLAPSIARRARECGAKNVDVSYVEDGRDLEENDFDIPVVQSPKES